jgi:hypothetical protein
VRDGVIRGGTIADEMRTLGLMLGVKGFYALNGFAHAFDDLGSVSLGVARISCIASWRIRMEVTRFFGSMCTSGEIVEAD